MKIETLFEKFDLYADAPDAVAEMRGLILRLAMQGKLSESHKRDVPVSDLLRDVEKERAALGIKRSRDAENESSQAAFFKIPSRWTWTQFGELARHNAGKTLDKGRNRGELRDYITTSNLYWGFFQLDDVRRMPIEDDELDRCTATKGDLLIVEGGEAGRAAVWCHNYDIAFQNHIHRARFFAGIDPYFVQRYFETLNATGEIEHFRKGVGISNMSGKALASIPIPLPPLAEQKRIVAKLGELMALCDRLEAQQQERKQKHAALARASLARFADAPTPSNLDFLFHKCYDITPADLRKTILTLAVQGKLVPQDPNDEPAEVSVPKLASLAVASEDDQFPAHWLRVPLGKMGEWRGGGTPSKARPEFWKGDLPWVSPKDMKVLHIADAQDHVSPAAVEDSFVRLIPPGSLLMVVRGMILARAFPVALTMREVTINQDMKALLPTEPKTKEYLLVALRAFEPDVLAAIEHSSHGTCKLKTEFLQDFVIPLPPLAEQRRIVAKVEQLMALLDQLETQLAASRATSADLMKAVVAELTAGKESDAAA